MESDTATKRRGSCRDGAEGRAGVAVRPLISELHSPRRDPRPGGSCRQTVIPGSVQSNRDRAELVALRAAGDGRGLRYGGRISGDRPVRLVTGAVIPIDGGLV